VARDRLCAGRGGERQLARLLPVARAPLLGLGAAIEPARLLRWSSVAARGKR
jgi:hypothetical protein